MSQAVIEQPIGWRVSFRTPAGHAVAGLVLPTREEAEREGQRVRFAHGGETVVSITPVYVKRAVRQKRYKAAQMALSDLPVQRKTFDPIMELPKK